MPMISDEQYQEYLRLKQGQAAPPSSRPPGMPAQAPQAPQAPQMPGMPQTAGGPPPPRQWMPPGVTASYGTPDWFLQQQGQRNPGYSYSQGEGVWRYTGSPSGQPPPGAQDAFNRSWQQLGAENPAASGLSLDSQGFPLDQYGNRIPGAKSANQAQTQTAQQKLQWTPPDGLAGIAAQNRMYSGGY